MRKGIVTTNPLYWMPFDLDRWLGELAGGLRPDQKGALIDLLATAWRQNPPCTLQNDAGYLASKSGLGRDWKKLSGPILANFEATDDGRLICRWLRTIYDEQMAKYENRSHAGKGNRGKRGEAEQTGTDGSTNGSTNGTEQNTPPPHVTGTNGGAIPGTNGTESGTNGTTEVRGVMGPKGPNNTDSGLKESAPAALGPSEGRAAAGQGPDWRTLLAATESPYDAAEKHVNSEAAKRDSEARWLNEEYTAELFQSVEQFRSGNPRGYESHRIEAIKAAGLFGRDMTPQQQASIDEAVAVRIQRAEHWPTRTQWIANRQKGKIEPMAKRVAVPA